MKSDNSLPHFQNANEALGKLREANKSGSGITVSTTGDIEAIPQKGKPGRFGAILIYFKKCFGLYSAAERAEKSVAAAAIINKMKIEVHHLISQKISQIDNIIEYKNRNIPAERIPDFSGSVRKAMDDALENFHENLNEIKKLIKNEKYKEASIKWELFQQTIDKKTDKKSRELRLTTFSENVNKGPKTLFKDAKKDNYNQEAKPFHQFVESSASSKKSTPTQTRDINNALPKYVSRYSGRIGEILQGGTKLPREEIKEEFKKFSTSAMDRVNLLPKDDEMTEIDLNDDNSFIEFNNDPVEICHQFILDANRSGFSFQNANGRTENFALGSDPADVTRSLAVLCGGKGSVLKTLSQFVNQNAIGILYVNAIAKSKTRSNELVNLGKSIKFEPRVEDRTLQSGNRSPRVSNCTYTVRKVADNFEVEFLYLQKVHTVGLEGSNSIAVNRGDVWEGDVNEKNWGLRVSAKILLKTANLEQGKLDELSFIEEPSVDFRLAPDPDGDVVP